MFGMVEGMPGRREFELKQVLDSACGRAVWRGGYRATSVDDLAGDRVKRAATRRSRAGKHAMLMGALRTGTPNSSLPQKLSAPLGVGEPGARSRRSGRTSTDGRDLLSPEGTGRADAGQNSAIRERGAEPEVARGVVRGQPGAGGALRTAAGVPRSAAARGINGIRSIRFAGQGLGDVSGPHGRRKANQDEEVLREIVDSAFTGHSARAFTDPAPTSTLPWPSARAFFRTYDEQNHSESIPWLS